MADEPAFTPIQVYLTVKGGDAASKFYQKAFGAKELQRQFAEDKKRLMHCDLSMFGGNIMLSDEFPEMGQSDTLSPVTRGGASATIHVNFRKSAEIDRVMKEAAKAGARITMPAADMFWGARYGRIVDPFGHSWSFGAPAEKPAAARAARPAVATKKKTKPSAVKATSSRSGKR
jgi:PhnB protein